ncbi:hypothetical protein [Mitsuaria sp. 7]|uniref:hypothetical protein n=1 Tax=Mitsuaria sp. 7 TaxID=1658665 RepID=UPI0007DD24A4|nr:hypothetical protein [Mitsuaria sp. 7]ANH67333.1 hypothetical protein ABE85_06690 [Mitsuaria sp. 7]
MLIQTHTDSLTAMSPFDLAASSAEGSPDAAESGDAQSGRPTLNDMPPELLEKIGGSMAHSDLMALKMAGSARINAAMEGVLLAKQLAAEISETKTWPELERKLAVSATLDVRHRQWPLIAAARTIAHLQVLPGEVSLMLESLDAASARLPRTAETDHLRRLMRVLQHSDFVEAITADEDIRTVCEACFKDVDLANVLAAVEKIRQGEPVRKVVSEHRLSHDHCACEVLEQFAAMRLLNQAKAGCDVRDLVKDQGLVGYPSTSTLEAFFVDHAAGDMIRAGDTVQQAIERFELQGYDSHHTLHTLAICHAAGDCVSAGEAPLEVAGRFGIKNLFEVRRLARWSGQQEVRTALLSPGAHVGHIAYRNDIQDREFLELMEQLVFERTARQRILSGESCRKVQQEFGIGSDNECNAVVRQMEILSFNEVAAPAVRAGVPVDQVVERFGIRDSSLIRKLALLPTGRANPR